MKAVLFKTKHEAETVNEQINDALGYPRSNNDGIGDFKESETLSYSDIIEYDGQFGIIFDSNTKDFLEKEPIEIKWQLE